MYTAIVFPDSYSPFLQELQLGLYLLVSETITYPLDRISTRCIAKQNKGSILFHKEYIKIFQEIIQKEKNKGLFHGLKSRLDQSISKIVIRYYLFQLLYYNFAHQNHVFEGFKPENQLSNIDDQPVLTPDNPHIYPLLLYSKIDFKLLIINGIAGLVGQICSHPVSLLKIKTQCEPLGDISQTSLKDVQKMIDITKFHDNKKLFWIKAAFWPRFVYNQIQFNLEIYFFQQYLERNQYEFINVFKEEKQTQKDNFLLNIIFNSVIVTTITQPIYFYYIRKSIAEIQKVKYGLSECIQNFKNEGIQMPLKGFLPNLLKSVVRNTICTGLMWLSAKRSNLNRFIE
ncbi:hypothetical protein pb186bvf_015828 [Paramecium bursaria]